MTLSQPRRSPTADRRKKPQLISSSRFEDPFEDPSFGSGAVYPGERTSIQVGCLSERETLKKRLESKRSASARGKGSRRKQITYSYIEYWFHWKEPGMEGKPHCRSCYLGGHPKGQQPKGKLVSRLDTVETQYKRGRPYGETLALIGMADKAGSSRRRD
jgi:hypothetical protein